MDGVVPNLIILLILVCLSAFFSSAETSLVSVNKIKLRTLADSGNKSAVIALKLTENPNKLLSTILIGNNIVNLSASSLATILVQKAFDNIPISVATCILTIVILIFGEIMPKTAATLYADTLSLVYAPVIYVLCFVLTPVIFILNKISRFFMILMHIDPDKKTASMTEDEFLTVVDVSHEEGVIETKEREMIENVVDFGDSRAKDIMIPRIDIQFIEDSLSYDEIAAVFSESNFSRLPVFHETTDNVTGILFLKDLFKWGYKKESFKLTEVMRKPFLTFENKRTADLLSEMRQKNLSIAVVLDEYGATAGLITVEDLIEEIVGELRDEYDNDEEDIIRKTGVNEFIVDGSARADDIADHLNIKIETEDFDSIAGYVIHILEHLPKENEIAYDDYASYKVIKVTKNRIDKLLIKLISTESDGDKDA